jgi:hypothetical protein
MQVREAGSLVKSEMGYIVRGSETDLTAILSMPVLQECQTIVP